MRVAVIGFGKMGRAFAEALADAGMEVIVGLRSATKAKAVTDQMAGRIHGVGIADAIGEAEVVILAVPYTAHKAVLKIAGDVQGKILVDVSNPVSDDHQSLAIGHSTSAAEELKRLAPGAKIVKAFNTIFATLVSKSARRGRQLQVFIAGDDIFANVRISEMASRLNFDPISAGPLSNSRFLEPIGQMNIQFRCFLNGGAAIAPSWVHV
ncbi:NADPH-dependent F420 reductase [Herbaspirillum robiniae]|uniref:NADPH-dependent F420 reductase n=1 Tax=Herbaspirillum robiniae TaxID=2014887 RepID=UPI003D785454